MPAMNRHGTGPGRLLPPLWTIFAFWTLVAVIAAGHAAPHHESMARGVLYELVNHWAWAVLTPPIFVLAHRFPLDRTPAAVAWLVHVVAAAVVGILWGTFSEIAHQRIAHPADPAPPVREVLASNAAFGFSSGLLVYFAILASAHALSYYRQSRARRSEALALRTELAEARLRALRMQLQPHFLFNTLNTVSGLVESDPATTRRVVARLSELLRHTLESSDVDEVPLSRELELLESYLEIVEARYGDRFRIIREIDPDTLTAVVPPLCLQPLVENAVEHGVGRRPEGGTVVVAARVAEDRLELEVRDDGPGAIPDASSAAATDGWTGGVGIRNVRDRLRHLHGDEASVAVQSRPGGGTVQRVVVPFVTSVEERSR